MIGIIPGNHKTLEIVGDTTSENPIEGKLYYNAKGRLFFFSTKIKRSNPESGFFPIWDGKEFYISNFSNEKYLDKDTIRVDASTLSGNINKDVADQVLYLQRRSDSSDILRPSISDEDNMFTQCIKGVLNAKDYTIIDLVEMSKPSLSQKMIENYYNALGKIAFMRPDKWFVWINTILHVTYQIDVYKEGKRFLTYHHKDNTFDLDDAKYNSIVNGKDDVLKKIIKVLMNMENITKSDLKKDGVDDYTINNMMTTLGSTKAISAQLFSRFIQLSELSYTVKMIEDDKVIFEYHE